MSEPDLSAAEAGAARSDGRVVLDTGLLKSLRKARSVSQEALAELCFQRRLSVSIASIKRAETGRPVLYRTARHLAAIYGVEVAAICAAAEPQQTRPSCVPPRQAASPSAGDSGRSRTVAELRAALHVDAASPGDDGLGSLLRRFGGVQADAEGEYSLIHFGLPQAYRSDVERALLCAFALRERLARPGSPLILGLGSWPGATDRPPPEVPAPVDGDEAPIYVARSLVRPLSARFEFAPTLLPHGLRECLRERPAGRYPLHRLCGRVVEVQQFKGLIEVTEEYQEGHVVYLRGPVGIGKTRLLTEFADLAREAGFACHHADVLDFGEADWHAPLGELVRSVLRQGWASPDGSGAPEQGPANWPLPPDCGIFLALMTGAPLAPEAQAQYATLAPEARQRSAVRALQALLTRSALHQPLLICIEDLHWGAAGLLAVLGDLLACTEDAPIVWVFTSRREDDPLETVLRPRFSSPLTLLDLGPMRPREACALAEQFDEVDTQYRALCVERAQGNPLYLTQLLSDPEQRLPDSLKHLIQARLDRLEQGQQQALGMAAVMGKRFDLALLREALGQPDFVPAARVCPSMIREIEAGGYGFVHDLVMHCIYDAIPPARREQLHRGVAQVYRTRNATLHAQHLLRANDPAAFDALLVAVSEKLRACQYDSAVELAQQCDRFPERAAASFSLTLLRARAMAGLGMTAMARDHFQRAMILAQQSADRIEVALGLAPVLNILDCLDEEELLLAQTVPLARQLQADSALARLFQLLGNLYFPRGDYARSRQHHEQALHYAQLSQDVEMAARATSGIGDSYYSAGGMARAYELFDRCVSMGEQNGLLSVEASNRGARASTAIYLGRPVEALHDADNAVRRSRQVGDRRAEIFSRLTASWVLVAGAAHGRASEELGCALELARETGAARFEAFILEGMARVAFHEGRQAHAEQHIEQAAALVESQQLHAFVGPWVYGTMALVTETDDVRRQCLRVGRAQLGRGALAHNSLRFHVAAAELCLLDGDVEQACLCAEQLRSGGGPEPCAWVTGHGDLIAGAADWLQRPGADTWQSLQTVMNDAATMGYAMTMPRLMRRIGNAS